MSHYKPKVKQTKDTDKNGDEPVKVSSAEIEEKDLNK